MKTLRKWCISYHCWIMMSCDSYKFLLAHRLSVMRQYRHFGIGYHLTTDSTTSFESRHQWLIQDTLTFCSSGQAVSHYENDAPNCLASMQIQPCWLMLGVVSARMLMLWQVCSMLNKKNTGIAEKANTASQMKAKMYVTMINCNEISSVALKVREIWQVMNVVSLNSL